MSNHYNLMCLLALGIAVCLGAPQPAQADTKAKSGQILVISDEIRGDSVNVRRPESDGGSPSSAPAAQAAPAAPVDDGDVVESGSPAGNDRNRSGLGDGTNPGQGSGRENSPNEGTDNPAASRGRKK